MLRRASGAVFAATISFGIWSEASAGGELPATELNVPAATSQAIPSAQSSGVNLNKPAHFQIWRKITLGTYKGVEAYRRALDSAGIKIGDAADEILGRPAFPYARTKTGVELAVQSAADLGVESDQASVAEVYQRARQAGLELCPAEVGPQLRLDYRKGAVH